jgi:hypothetical protein
MLQVEVTGIREKEEEQKQSRNIRKTRYVARMVNIINI